MAAELIIAPEAQQDLAEAYDWYEGQRVGLGEEFLGRVDACIHGIIRDPEMHKLVQEYYRRRLVRRFPYVGFLRIRRWPGDDLLRFHTARNPGKWRRRLP